MDPLLVTCSGSDTCKRTLRHSSYKAVITGGSKVATHSESLSPVSGAQYTQSLALASPVPGCDTLQSSTVPV